jgi:hypothetical protein
VLTPTPIRQDSLNPVEHRASRVGLAVLLVATLVIDYATYKRVQPFAPGARVSQWVPVAVIVGVGIVAMMIVGRHSFQHVRFVGPARAILIVATLASAIALAYFSWGIPDYLQYSPSAAATQQAASALRVATANGSCVVIRRDATGILPTPFERCAFSSSSYPSVEFRVNFDFRYPSEPPYYGFNYSPSGPPISPDTCVDHVSGPWWAVIEQAVAGACPNGYQLQGAPQWSVCEMVG